LLKFVGWNEDDTYAHTIKVRIGVLERDQLEPTFSLSELLKKFLRLVGVR